MMGFVIIVGYQAIQAVSDQDCVQQSDKMLEEFKTTLELVASSNQNKKLALDLPSCSPKKDQLLVLKFEQDPSRCAKQCATARSACILLYFDNQKFSRIKCINIKPQTVFNTDSSSCVYRDGYGLYDLFNEDSILEGNWFFKNITPASRSDSPVICAFRQCSGSTC